MADACECGNEPSGSVKCGNILTSCKLVSCSGRTLHHGVSKYILSVYSSSKCSLFHNCNLFASCIIHILYMGVLNFKKNSDAKRLIIIIIIIIIIWWKNNSSPKHVLICTAAVTKSFMTCRLDIQQRI